MLKKTMFVFLFFGSLQAMEKEIDIVKISECCQKRIQQITKDTDILSLFFENLFQQVGTANNTQYTPSTILQHLASDKFNPDQIEKLHFQTFKSYINDMRLHQNTFDEVFEKHYNEAQNIQQAWTIFWPYFKQKALVEPAIALKYALMCQDQYDNHMQVATNYMLSNNASQIFVVGRPYDFTVQHESASKN